MEDNGNSLAAPKPSLDESKLISFHFILFTFCLFSENSTAG